MNGEGAAAALSGKHLVCVHAVPHGAIAGEIRIDVGAIDDRTTFAAPIGSTGYNSRFNADGLFRENTNGGALDGYFQLFRNGIVESVDSQKVADTMSRRITTMNHGQGLAANLSTGVLVMLASTYGLPVSTTHVSVGSLFGIGLTAQTANAPVMRAIMLSWLLTLPCGAVLGGLVYWMIGIAANPASGNIWL